MMQTNLTSEDNASELLSLFNTVAEPTNQALAITYNKMGWRILPVNDNKSPLVDPSLGYIRGLKDAICDIRKAAITWHIHPGAGIGWAIDEHHIVIDWDVQKDANKKPIKVNGMPVQVGLSSFQEIVLELGLTKEDLSTLSQITQSGGGQLFYRMPEGIQSFNHTGVLPYLDIKGAGGYVILPNSLGKYGQYRFRNLVPIKEIPEALLQWLQDHTTKGNTTTTIPKPQYVTDDRTEKLIGEIAPVWIGASGRRWKLGKAIAGALYREGWDFERADAVLQRLCDMIPNGREHRQICKWVYSKMKTENYRIEGFTTLRKFIEELGGEQDDKQ